MQMRHLYFNLKDLFSNRKGFVIFKSLLRFKNKSRQYNNFSLSDTNRNFQIFKSVSNFIKILLKEGVVNVSLYT